MRVKSKIWLEEQSGLIFGSGRACIVRAVADTGSISKAAIKLGMSYRRVWSYIRSAEERLGASLFIKTKGGKGGGGAVLTAFAKDLVIKFEKLDKEVSSFADQRFKEIF